MIMMKFIDFLYFIRPWWSILKNKEGKIDIDSLMVDWRFVMIQNPYTFFDIVIEAFLCIMP